MDYDTLLTEVTNFGSALMSWNLKYDKFPDIKDWITKNWAAAYGSEVVERYLNACMAERSANYWGGTHPSGAEKNEAFKALRNLIADLKGDAPSPSHISATLRRIASAIENSKRPSRARVARDLNNLVSRIATTDESELIRAGDAVVILSKWAKSHIFGTHGKPGKGSVFSTVDMNKLKSEIESLKIPGPEVVYKVSVPGAGYNLVIPTDEAKLLPDAEEIPVEKDEGKNKIKVKGFKTSQPMTDFATNEVCIIIVPARAEFIEPELKEDETVIKALDSKKLFSVVSAWPGVETPPASQWDGKWAVIIPDQTHGTPHAPTVAYSRMQ